MFLLVGIDTRFMKINYPTQIETISQIQLTSFSSMSDKTYNSTFHKANKWQARNTLPKMHRILNVSFTCHSVSKTRHTAGVFEQGSLKPCEAFHKVQRYIVYWRGFFVVVVFLNNMIVHSHIDIYLYVYNPIQSIETDE